MHTPMAHGTTLCGTRVAPTFAREPIPKARSRGLRGEACRSAQPRLQGQSIEESKP